MIATNATASDRWAIWSTEAVLVITEPSRLRTAHRLVDETLAEVERACSRFRPDSELSLLRGRMAGGVAVSRTLAALVDAALRAAAWTDGDVDPTVGLRLAELGYDRDLAAVGADAEIAVEVHPLPASRNGWRRIRLDGDRLTVPDDLALDLGATAKAVAADRAAARVAAELGCGAFVGLGGDIATAGPGPDGGWQVRVQDLPADPAQQVSLSPGWAIATSSTQKRRWSAGGRRMHHILDPRSGLPAPETWRSVTAVARDCLRANAVSTAAIVRGPRALAWMRELGVAGRLVDASGRVHTTGAWPAPTPSPEPEEAVDVR
ncbi:FAD:protein FMN transferase [Gryllotalpicola ginsengisoli]|uniref:FAD:protein FMN transferase n=1 Tax=Gryllotalpicola ginsengisoli TaxID=444608 RepID=UPI0003B30069|nr:FAD:protein FMN transferase [Gryllotalpicola ginsengisoli]